MSDLKLIIESQMRAMVGRLGCFDAVAETINARWGGSTAKGTISRKANGSLTWDILDIIALEDALGCNPITQTLAKRSIKATQTGDSLCPIAHAAIVSKETGEAVSALLAAAQSDSAGDRAEAYRELEEAEMAIRAAKERMRGAME